MNRVVGAQAYAVPQAQLEEFLEGWGPRGEGPVLCLALDTREGGVRLDDLADRVDLLVYGSDRGGFGSARRRMLLAGRLFRADEVLLCDADGQYDSRVLGELPPLGQADAAIPQRQSIDLPLAGGGRLNRLAAEAFQAWCVAHGAGRPDLAWLDMQPGAFLLGPRAVKVVEQVTAAGFSWDLEATWRLLASDLRLEFPPVTTRPQHYTSFTAADADRNLASVAAWFGADRVEEWLGRFLEEAAGRYPDLEDFERRARGVLRSGS